MIKEERKKEKKKKRRKKGWLIAISTIIIVLAILFAIAWNAFKVKNVIIEGNELYDDEVVEEIVLNDDYSWNALYVFVKYRFMKTKSIPFIDTVEVTLADRNTIKIKVYEKGMMGYVYDAGLNQNVYFDKDGVVAEISDRTIEGIPQIKGLEYGEIKLYEELDITNERLSDILVLTQSLKREKLVPDYIIYGGENAPIAVYGNVWVQFGSIQQISAKTEHLTQILPMLSEESGILHFESWTEDSSNVVFDRDE